MKEIELTQIEEDGSSDYCEERKCACCDSMAVYEYSYSCNEKFDSCIVHKEISNKQRLIIILTKNLNLLQNNNNIIFNKFKFNISDNGINIYSSYYEDRLNVKLLINGEFNDVDNKMDININLLISDFYALFDKNSYENISNDLDSFLNILGFKDDVDSLDTDFFNFVDFSVYYNGALESYDLFEYQIEEGQQIIVQDIMEYLGDSLKDYTVNHYNMLGYVEHEFSETLTDINRNTIKHLYSIED